MQRQVPCTELRFNKEIAKDVSLKESKLRVVYVPVNPLLQGPQGFKSNVQVPERESSPPRATCVDQRSSSPPAASCVKNKKVVCLIL